MKVYCHTSVDQYVEHGEHRIYESGKMYNLDPNEEFAGEDGYVFIYTGVLDGNIPEGCRFVLNYSSVGNCSAFRDYFMTEKEMRKLKLDKINNG